MWFQKWPGIHHFPFELGYITLKFSCSFCSDWTWQKYITVCLRVTSSKQDTGLHLFFCNHTCKRSVFVIWLDNGVCVCVCVIYLCVCLCFQCKCVIQLTDTSFPQWIPQRRQFCRLITLLCSQNLINEGHETYSELNTLCCQRTTTIIRHAGLTLASAFPSMLFAASACIPKITSKRKTNEAEKPVILVNMLGCRHDLSRGKGDMQLFRAILLLQSDFASF